MIEISAEEKKDAVILNIAGEIIMSTTNEIDNACRQYINSGLKVIAFDLKSVIFIDSFGISRIIKISKTITEHGTDFVLINLNDNIKQIFQIATFDRFFTILTKEAFTEKYLQY